MFFAVACPVSDEDRCWIDERMHWKLRGQFGDSLLAAVTVVTPTREFFPDGYDGSAEAVEALFQRTCGYMRVDRARIRLGIYSDEPPWASTMVPLLADASHQGTGGCFLGQDEDGRLLLALAEDQLRDAASLVAVMAHELGHVLLLGDKRLTGRESDHEQLTDLLTVALGMGVFTATAAFQFQQWQDGQWQGWSAKRMGYLTEAQFGYASALFAWLRSERKAQWASFLPTNVHSFFKKSTRFIEAHPPPGLRRL